MVVQIERGGPAAKAGLLPGDVIVEFNGERVESIDDLHRTLTETLIGREIGLVILKLEKKTDAVIIPSELH